MREYADRARLPEDVIAKRIHLQVMARLAPHKISVPRDWRPWTMFDRHMTALWEAGKCDAGRRR
jgi:hypothetical protein